MKLVNYIGQKHLIGEHGPIKKMIDNGHFQSIILYGNPGIGKTTLANKIAMDLRGETFSANVGTFKKIEYPKTQVLEILRLMDYDAASTKYKGIKFPKAPPKGIFTQVDDTCKNLKADVTWEQVLYEVEEAHKTNKEVFKKKGIVPMPSTEEGRNRIQQKLAQ